MMKTFWIGVLVAAMSTVHAQQVVQVLEEQTFTLKGETKAIFGGKARAAVLVELPAGTQRWFYAFTSVEEADAKKSIGLIQQIEQKLATGSVNVEELKAPSGNLTMEVYVFDESDKNTFINSQGDFGLTDFHYEKEYTILRKTYGVMEIDDIDDKKVFIGLKNPNSIENAQVTLEIVAIVGGVGESSSSVTSNEDQLKKAEMYGNLAWKKVQEGAHEAAIDYANKSLLQSKLGWVLATKGLAQLISGNEGDALETYIDAIVLINKQDNSTALLKEQLQRLDQMTSGKSISGADEIRDLISAEL